MANLHYHPLIMPQMVNFECIGTFCSVDFGLGDALSLVASDEINAMGKAWQEWLEGIEREFRFFKISEAVDKKDATIIYGGNEIARLEKSLPETSGDERCVHKTAYEFKRPFYPEEE